MSAPTYVVGSLWASVNGLEQPLAPRRREFNALQAEVEGICKSQEEWECLAISGTHFHTRCNVLGGNSNKFFPMLVSKEFTNERGPNRSIFIDSDPFSESTSSLHGGKVHTLLQGKGFLREARYYGLPEFGDAKCSW